MKTWEEVNGESYLYLAEECHTVDDDDNNIIIPQFQKCGVVHFNQGELLITVNSGKYAGEELYYYTKSDKPEELLTKKELDLINTSETKIWKELKKIEEKIAALKETPSDELKQIFYLIKEHR